MFTRIRPQKPLKLTYRPNTHRTLFTRRITSTPTPLRTFLLTTTLVLTSSVFAVYYFDSRSALHRWIITPLLRNTLDPETAHRVAVRVLRSGWGPVDVLRDQDREDERLRVQMWGRTISNPVGLAAGFDKNGEAVDGLFNLGFSWVEIGSVTPKPQPGNPKPRVFHLPFDSAMINRYGFPSEGSTAVLARLRARQDKAHAADSDSDSNILAVSLGKNKASPVDSVEDYIQGVKTLGPYADVLVFNVSSPNTPGLRDLQSKSLLTNLLASVAEARDNLIMSERPKPKLVLKIAPDMDEEAIKDVADAVKASGKVDAVIVGNTTVQRPSSLLDANKSEPGGLSGPPLKPITLATLRTLRAHLPAEIPIIGCGGITSGRDAVEYARAGATMVQMYTGFGYDGVGACRRVKDQIKEELAREGTTWSALVRRATEGVRARQDAVGREKLAKEERERRAVEGVVSVTGGESSAVKALIAEAMELKEKLDRLGEKMSVGQGTEDANAIPALPPVPC